MELEPISLDQGHSISERRRTEIEYHRNLNVRIALVSIPVFLCFSIIYFLRGSIFQTLLYSLMSFNAVVVVAMVPMVQDISSLMRLKQVGSAVAFGLLGVSMVAAFFGRDLHIIFPYIFIYPMAVLFFFGERAGRYYAVAFCLITVGLVMSIDFYPWNADYIKVFKINTSVALIIMVVISLISERTRVQMRDKLIAARNQAQTAETLQRQTNIELKEEIERRNQSEKALSQSENRYRALFEESAVSLWEEDWSRVKIYLDGLSQEAAEDLPAYFHQKDNQVNHCIRRMRVTAVNRAALTLYEADTQTALFKNLRQIVPPGLDVQQFFTDRVVALYRFGKHQTDMQAQTFSGRKLHVMINTTIPPGYEDTWEKVYTSVYDITEKIAMEEEKKRLDLQVQHTRHFQAIVTLAGGIAHQFNNALGGIYGNLDLLEIKVKIDDRSKRYIAALRNAAGRIARLTEQLLAYARGGKFQPKAIELNTLLRELVDREIAPQFSQVRISTDLGDGFSRTIGDVTQIKAVMEAILINAMEASSAGGEVSISTCSQIVEQDHPAPDVELEFGSYVVTRIVDNGTGMDEETRQHIFEPFFSTKFLGRGLGMSAASGIIKNHGGDITVQSAPGKGTTVTVYLPVAR